VALFSKLVWNKYRFLGGKMAAWELKKGVKDICRAARVLPRYPRLIV
jgi:hypothetical protein